MGEADEKIWQEVGVCDHMEFEASVQVTRILRNGKFEGRLGLDVSAHCMECEAPVHFLGMQNGINPEWPTTSVDEREARLPGMI